MEYKLMDLASALPQGHLVVKHDPVTGLKAVIAIDNTAKGPAIGGTRCKVCESEEQAVAEVVALAQSMGKKAAMAGIPMGGGKALIIKPAQEVDHAAFFESYATMLNQLGGQFITGVDSGTLMTDFDRVQQFSNHVVSTSKTSLGESGDLSEATVHGIVLGIKAAVKSKLSKDDLTGIHVAIRGVGYVGSRLAKQLHDLGATLTICDIDERLVKSCLTEVPARVVAPEAIYEVDCDVFAPCALGGCINADTVPTLKASIVAGAANNVLASDEDGVALHQRGILYAPDYVINAGGVIYAYCQYAKLDMATAFKRIQVVYDNLIEIFEAALRDDKPCHEVADSLVLNGVRHHVQK